MSGKLDYLYIFLQSNLIEVIIYYFFYRKLMTLKRNFWLVSFSNSVTHPLVFFGFMTSNLNYLWATLAAETFAVFGEFVLHAQFGKVPWKRALAAALVANLVSWQLAPILTYLLFF